MTLRRLLRAIRLTFQRRVDCAPRFDSRAPYPALDNPGLESPRARDLVPVIVEPLNRHTERVHYGPGAHQHFLRYTAAWHEDNARDLANAWLPQYSGDHRPRQSNVQRRRFRDLPQKDLG